MMRESGPSRAAGKSRSWHASRPTHLCLEGEHGDGKAQEEETPCRADRRLGAARASLRVGRAEGVREDQAARPVRRAAPLAGVAYGNLREDALPQNLGLRTRRYAEPLRLTSCEEACPSGFAPSPHRGPQGRAPRSE